MMKVMILMSECIVPWCEEEATDILGKYWHSKFCDEHIASLENDSCVYLSPIVITDYGMNFDILGRKFVQNIQGCMIRDVNAVMMYNVEKMWYIISFDVDALRKKFDDSSTIFIDINEEKVA